MCCTRCAALLQVIHFVNVVLFDGFVDHLGSHVAMYFVAVAAFSHVHFVHW